MHHKDFGANVKSRWIDKKSKKFLVVFDLTTAWQFVKAYLIIDFCIVLSRKIALNEREELNTCKD